MVGVLQRRFFYALTAPTGHGKTAIMLLLAACVAQGKPFAGKVTKKSACSIWIHRATSEKFLRTGWRAIR